jgi:hypothetical protein
MNWYKIAFNHGIPKSENMDDKDVRNPGPLTQPSPLFGENERRGYPKGFSAVDTDNYAPPETIPGESVVMDDPQSEMAETQIQSQLDPFTDPKDSVKGGKDLNYKEPVGPHNMPHGNIFDELRQRSKTKGIRRT